MRGLDRAIIDEVQRAPELLLAVKQSIDEDYRPGRFLLTGSVNVMLLPKVADSLAGRIEIVTLLPLAQCEIAGHAPALIQSLFSERESNLRIEFAYDGPDDLLHRVLCGGYPEAYVRKDASRRRLWLQYYVRSVLTRDLRDIAALDKISELPRYFQYLANFSAKLVNYSELGSSIDISHKTSRRYLGLLSEVYLTATVPPWHRREIKRLIKTSKLRFIDSGILAVTKGLSFEKLRARRELLGPLLETFVFSELMKQIGQNPDGISLYHFRDQSQREVDFVLERADGDVVGIEVKALASVDPSDFNGLRSLQEMCGDNFRHGIVFYYGKKYIRFGERLAAVSISALWARFS